MGWVAAVSDVAAADRAAFSLKISSIERLQERIGQLLEIADRPELADVLAHRLAKVQDLPGIDRTRPLVLMRFPPADQPESDLLVIPTTDPKLLVQTITAGIVESSQTAEDLFTIARPDSPYYALVSKGWVWMGDSLPRLRSQALSGPPRPTHSGDPDLRLTWRWHAVPIADREAAIRAWKLALEPWLQRRDDEPDDVYHPRRLWGNAVLVAGETLWEYVDEISVSVRIDKAQRQGLLDFDVELALEHPAAAWLSRWQGTPHPLRQWADAPAARSSGFVQFPAGTLSATGDARPLTWGWQVFGDFLPVRTAVMVLDRRNAQETVPTLSDAAPDTDLTTIRVPKLPDWIRTWIGGNPEAIQLAEGNQTWWAFGPPELARDRLASVQQALKQQEARSDVESLPVADVRIPLKEVWDWFRFIDPIWAERQLENREDRVRITLDAHRQRLHLRVVIPEGGLSVVAGWFVDELDLDLQAFLSAP